MGCPTPPIIKGTHCSREMILTSLCAAAPKRCGGNAISDTTDRFPMLRGHTLSIRPSKREIGLLEAVVPPFH
jgi:hypothetical protein